MGKKKNRIVYKEEDLTPTNGCCLPIRGELCGFCRGTWHWFWTEFAAIIRRDELTDDEHDDADVEVLELRNVLPQGLLPLEERMYHWRCVGLHQPSETPSPNIEQRQPSVHPPGIRIISQQPDRIHFLQSFIDQSNELERSPASAVRKPLPNIQDLRVSPDLPGNRNMRRRRLWLPIPKKAFHDKTPAELKDAKLSNVIAEVSSNYEKLFCEKNNIDDVFLCYSGCYLSSLHEFRLEEIPSTIRFPPSVYQRNLHAQDRQPISCRKSTAASYRRSAWAAMTASILRRISC